MCGELISYNCPKELYKTYTIPRSVERYPSYRGDKTGYRSVFLETVLQKINIKITKLRPYSLLKNYYL